MERSKNKTSARSLWEEVWEFIVVHEKTWTKFYQNTWSGFKVRIWFIYIRLTSWHQTATNMTNTDIILSGWFSDTQPSTSCFTPTVLFTCFLRIVDFCSLGVFSCCCSHQAVPGGQDRVLLLLLSRFSFFPLRVVRLQSLKSRVIHLRRLHFSAKMNAECWITLMEFAEEAKNRH